MSSTPNSFHPFAYSPLSTSTSIRIVALYPGSENEPIRCSLQHIELEGAPYEALSYEWKYEAEDDPVIEVDGCQFKVRRNLFDALHYIRPRKQTRASLEHTDRHIWIDAISINQEDIPERSRQVQIMGRIFGIASGVIAWVGMRTDESDLAFSYLPRAIHRYEIQSRPISVSRISVEEAETILVWFNRSYWKRLWIVQEVQNSQQFRVMCGDKIFSSRELFSVMISILGISVDPESSIGRRWGSIYADCVAMRLIMELISVPVRDRSDRSLAYWIWECRDHQCSEKRDIVFALLGLASDYDLYEGGIFDYSMAPALLYRRVLELEGTDVLDLGFYNLGFAEMLAKRLDLPPAEAAAISQSARLVRRKKIVAKAALRIQ